jgi:hypothetical protein
LRFAFGSGFGFGFGFGDASPEPVLSVMLMTIIPRIVLPYGTQPAKVIGMLNHIVSAQATGRATGSTSVSEGSPYVIRPDVWLSWRPKRGPRQEVLSVAELADCTCPDLCDRDHANE